MVTPVDNDDDLYKKYHELCNKLNLDEKTCSQAWLNFQSIKGNYVLEGDLFAWLGCALYVACRTTTTPTVGQSSVEGNCVSLTSLLRYCDLGLIQFFNKISKWADMAQMPQEFRESIKLLETNFTITCNTFKKFVEIFTELFKCPIDAESPKQHRSRRQKPAPCSSSKVFEFCWTLFITVKSNDPDNCSGLVQSYHFLLACCDMIFANALTDERKDLLSPNFKGISEDYFNASFETNKNIPSIIDYFCKDNSSLLTTVKYVKEYCWKTQILDMFDKKLLHGDEKNLTGLLDGWNFESNFKNVTKMYETLVLNKGDFDERVFLDEYRRQVILNEQEAYNFNWPNSSTIRTSGVRVSKLQMLVDGQTGPSDKLVQILESCSTDPTQLLNSVVERIERDFLAEIEKVSNAPQLLEEARTWFTLSQSLFYKFTERILGKEKLKRDISHLAMKSIFYECALACSMEIVLYTNNFEHKFPWILEVLHVQPLDFVRVIELIVRSQEKLPRDVVKHLNSIEENIIECLMWKSDSNIWQALQNSREDFPKFEETALPGNMIYTEQVGLKRNVLEAESPGPSAIENFQSPINNHQSLVKKQLFVTKTIKSGQIILQSFKTEENESQRNTDDKPKRTGSLSIIIRKFYNLAYARLEQLCVLLNLRELAFKQKIWTTFEYSVRDHTELLKDRHLDQLLMCAIYIICKVANEQTISFLTIMDSYKKQQKLHNRANHSHIYRKVLISKEDDKEERGDLIKFYNSVYLGAIRIFAVKFSTNNTDLLNIHLSPVPANNPIVSPRCRITNNIFTKPYETPNNSAKGKLLAYHFSRSPSQDLEEINKAINTGKGIGKRLLVDKEGEYSNNKRLSNKKMQSLLEERQNQQLHLQQIEEMAELLSKSGIYFDEVDKVRILEPDAALQSNNLKEECKIYLEKIEEFQKIVDYFANLMEELGKEVETQKMKAIGARNVLLSMAQEKENQKQELQALIAEKSMELERLKIEVASLQKTEMEQQEIINKLTHN